MNIQTNFNIKVQNNMLKIYQIIFNNKISNHI